MGHDEKGHRADPDRLNLIRDRLLAAYDEERRDLPWRGESDPYRIWVAEVMLQQTRVETVIPYYMKWMDRFPRVEILAGAPEDEVLKLWQGLGYYSRARRLHGAAKLVRDRYQGSLPSSSSELRELPGVGEYTAGAVASIAFGERVPAVDGNVKRVLSRLFDLPAPGPGELRELASRLVDPRRPGDFNQAFMELGSQVCTPRSPSCESCPVAPACMALERGTVELRPAREKRKPVPETEVASLVAVGTDEPRFLVRKRPHSGLLAGMWEFPGVEAVRRAASSVTSASPSRDVASPSGSSAEDQARRLVMELARELGLAGDGEPAALAPVPHAFSHLRVLYWPFLVRVPGMPRVSAGRWVLGAELETLPLPVAQEKMARTARARVRKERKERTEDNSGEQEESSAEEYKNEF